MEQAIEGGAEDGTRHKKAVRILSRRLPASSRERERELIERGALANLPWQLCLVLRLLQGAIRGGKACRRASESAVHMRGPPPSILLCHLSGERDAGRTEELATDRESGIPWQTHASSLLPSFHRCPLFFAPPVLSLSIAPFIPFRSIFSFSLVFCPGRARPAAAVRTIQSAPMSFAPSGGLPIDLAAIWLAARSLARWLHSLTAMHCPEISRGLSSSALTANNANSANIRSYLLRSPQDQRLYSNYSSGGSDKLIWGVQ